MAPSTATGKPGAASAPRHSAAMLRVERGFTYMMVLFAVALIGLGLAAAAGVWKTAVQREKERELLFVGDQFRRAIGSYYENTPGGVKQYPRTLQQMLKDERYPTVMRHLRRIYQDPMTGKADWTLIQRPDGSIVGVASRSTLPPFKQDNFENPLDRAFKSAKTLSDWKFTYTPAAQVPTQAQGTATGGQPLPLSPLVPGISPSANPAQGTATGLPSAALPPLVPGMSPPAATGQPSAVLPPVPGMSPPANPTVLPTGTANP